jgi:2-iminobutanoate/2-iminopropanoate deaminase
LKEKSMPIPALPFSKIRRAGGLVFLAGEVPLADDGSIPQGIGPQTDLTLARTFNEAYARHFSDPLPVRTTVQAELMLGARAEITVIAQTRG